MVLPYNKRLCEKEITFPNIKTLSFTMDDTRRTRSVAEEEGNKFPTMKELRVEVIRLGRAVVDLRGYFVSADGVHKIYDSVTALIRLV